MEKYIMAMDAGTTSCRTIIFNKNGSIVSMAQQEFTQHYPKPGWVEHDASEIYSTQIQVSKKALEQSGIGAKEIAAIGITNQRESVVLWDKKTGEPVAPAVCWQCRRSASICKNLLKEGYAPVFKEKTGLLLDAYFSGTKIKWLLDQNEELRIRAKQGKILVGTIESFIIWKLTRGKVHVTDYSNASRTLLFNINTLKWDEELCNILDIPMNMLPKPMESSCIYGTTESDIFGSEITIGGAVGDQQASLFGQCCFNSGESKITYGTGGFLLMNTGNAPIYSDCGLLTTIAWGLNGRVAYALEGSFFMAGATIQWLRDELGIINSSEESETLAMKVPDSGGCYVVPAFTGLGAPYWDSGARGTIIGLTRGINKCHIVRATLESIAFQACDVLEIMEKEVNSRISSLYVDGGACKNNILLQMQSDYLNTQVKRPSCIETTALGAAYLAGLSVGYWDSINDILSNAKVDKTFSPTVSEEVRKMKLDGWHRAVERALGWEK